MRLFDVLSSFPSPPPPLQCLLFPQTHIWLTHTTLPPRFNPDNGLMAKPYLGRYYYIRQLNAAAATAAGRLGLQLVDYAALGEPFMAGQSYLGDLIHPNKEVIREWEWGRGDMARTGGGGCGYDCILVAIRGGIMGEEERGKKGREEEVTWAELWGWGYDGTVIGVGVLWGYFVLLLLLLSS